MTITTDDKDPAQFPTAVAQEKGFPASSKTLHTLPRWPRYLSIALHILVVLFCVSILALVSHSLHSYSSTRNIKFSGISESWPEDLNLRPPYFFLAISSLSLAFSFTSPIYIFIRRNSGNFEAFDVISVVINATIFVIWIAGDVVQHQSQKHSKSDILEWSCRREESPTNVLVNYASICNEQVCLCPSLTIFLF